MSTSHRAANQTENIYSEWSAKSGGKPTFLILETFTDPLYL